MVSPFFPFFDTFFPEVAVSGKVPGVVLADQVKSLDWTMRKARRKGAVDPLVLAEVRAKARALIGQ